MKKKIISVLVGVTCIIVIGVLMLLRFSNEPEYDEYTDIDNSAQYADNKLIDNDNIIDVAVQEHKDELISLGVTDTNNYEVSYSSNNTVVTVVFDVGYKTVYLEIMFDEELSNVISYYIFDDQEAE